VDNKVREETVKKDQLLKEAEDFISILLGDGYVSDSAYDDGRRLIERIKINLATTPSVNTK
jgi:hypothetical protein